MHDKEVRKSKMKEAKEKNKERKDERKKNERRQIKTNLFIFSHLNITMDSEIVSPFASEQQMVLFASSSTSLLWLL